jgi:hypothetical protein
MQIGSPEHKAQLLQELQKTYQENVWKEELALSEFDNVLGDFRKQLARADLKLENKEYSSAGEGKKVIARIQSDIESVKAAIKKTESQKEFWNKRLELIKNAQESV